MEAKVAQLESEVDGLRALLVPASPSCVYLLGRTSGRE
jgi:hypothetical protein